MKWTGMLHTRTASSTCKLKREDIWGILIEIYRQIFFKKIFWSDYFFNVSPPPSITWQKGSLPYSEPNTRRGCPSFRGHCVSSCASNMTWIWPPRDSGSLTHHPPAAATADDDGLNQRLLLSCDCMSAGRLARLQEQSAGCPAILRKKKGDSDVNGISTSFCLQSQKVPFSISWHLGTD